MITYENKIFLNENSDIPNENKVTDNDMNEIKSVVNTNENKVGNITNLNTTDKSSIVNAINELKSGDVYSESEVKTNKVWINNKPIYRKVIDFGGLPNYNIKNINHNISNLGTVTNVYGVFSNGTNQMIIPAGNDYNSSVLISSTQIGIATPLDLTSFSGYVIIEYTKTTD